MFVMMPHIFFILQLYFIFNGHNSTGLNLFKPRPLFSKTPKTLLNDLSLIKKVSLSDLHSFLVQDHTSFSVLSLSAKHILSTNRLTISLTKNSAKSFYLGPQRPKK